MEHARGGLQKIILDALRKAAPADAAVLAWPLVCGAAVAAKTRALELKERTLRIEVPDASWRRQLEELAPRYVAALNELAPKTVGRVEFVVSGGNPLSRNA